MTEVAGCLSLDGSPLTASEISAAPVATWVTQHVVLCGARCSCPPDGIAVATHAMADPTTQNRPGPDMFGIGGDWVCAEWQSQSHTLILTRAAAGLEGVYYWSDARRFLFANRLSRLIAMLGARARLDVAAAAMMMCAVLPAPGHTVWQGVGILLPAHRLVLNGGHIGIALWHVRRVQRLRGTDADLLAQFREEYRAAVRRSLVGVDGACGLHLSGGLDSTSLAALAAPMLADRGGLRGYVARPLPGTEPYPGRVIDEWPLAQVLTTIPGLTMTGVICPSEGFVAGLDHVLALHAQPVLAFANIGWILRIAACAARDGVRAMLTGAGGNTTISWPGTPTVFHPPWAMSWGGWRSWARGFLPAGVDAKLRMRAARRNPAADILTTHYRAQIGFDEACYDQFLRRWHAMVHPSVRGVTYDKMRSGNALANNAGPISMAIADAFAMTTRDPTNDPILADFCISLPNRLFWAGGMRRGLIRCGFRTVLPSEILHASHRGVQGADLPLRLLADAPKIDAVLTKLRSEGYGDLIDLDLAQARWQRLRAQANADPYRYDAYGLGRVVSLGVFLLRYVT